MQKRFIGVIGAAAVVALSLAGCSSSAGTDSSDGGDSGEKRVFRVAFNQPEAHPQAQAILALGEELEEQTDGQYSIELYADGTLGAQEATIEQIQSGTIDFAFVAGSLLESFNSDMAVVNLPYMYESPEHQMEVLNDDAIVGDLYATLEEDDIKILAASHAGVRNVYTDKPIEVPADLEGYKLRVIGSDTNIRMMELMGGIGTPMAQDEVYTAIQSGVIDGAENNEIIYSSLAHDEIAPYYSYTKHLMMPDYFISSPGVWDSLDADTQEIFSDLLDVAVEDALAGFYVSVDESETAAKEAGATFVEADADAFREAVLPLHEEVINTPEMQSVYDAIEAARG
ncbi:TRAP transporter substrate-binding protein (plasmid) [Coraliomargarita sp. W4R53]